MLSGAAKTGALATLCLGVCWMCAAQQTTADPSLDDSKPEPVLSGGVAFVPTWDGGKPILDLIASPVLLVPLGNNFFFESRGEFEGEFQRRNGNIGDFTGAIDKSLDYAELDYTAIDISRSPWAVSSRPSTSLMSVCIPRGFATRKPTR